MEAQAQAQAVKQITEQESLQLARNLLRIAVFNISYMRGLFPDKYFVDSPVSDIEMNVKRLVPYDSEARRLIDWMEKGVYDALQKKYLKLLLFGICSGEDGPLIEEYEFFFSYPKDTSEVQMTIGRAGDEKSGRTFDSATMMRKSVCRMVRTLIQLMRTLENVPSERTIIMKLLYYDDVTPEDYEPPFFRSCTEEDKVTWLRAPVKVSVGGVKSRHHAVALKVRSTLDACEDENMTENENDASTMGVLRSNGSEETRQGDEGLKKPRSVSPTVSVCQPVASGESTIPAKGKKRMDIDQIQNPSQSKDRMNVDQGKASKVQEPIYQLKKRARRS